MPIDQYLASPEFASFWAQKWSDVMRNEEKTLTRTALAEAVQLDEHSVRTRSSTGSVRSTDHYFASRTHDNPAVNYRRAHRDAFIRSETTQVFLASLIGKARNVTIILLIDGPDEYYQWSSVFEGSTTRSSPMIATLNPDKHEFIGDQIASKA
ncbi:MAG: hypothetical protein U0930_20675 [Pirellulales bacterium]